MRGSRRLAMCDTSARSGRASSGPLTASENCRLAGKAIWHPTTLVSIMGEAAHLTRHRACEGAPEPARGSRLLGRVRVRGRRGRQGPAELPSGRLYPEALIHPGDHLRSRQLLHDQATGTGVQRGTAVYTIGAQAGHALDLLRDTTANDLGAFNFIPFAVPFPI